MVFIEPRGQVGQPFLENALDFLRPPARDHRLNTLDVELPGGAQLFPHDALCVRQERMRDIGHAEGSIAIVSSGRLIFRSAAYETVQSAFCNDTFIENPYKWFERNCMLLAEEFLTLALTAKRRASGTALGYGLAGALMAELSILDKIVLQGQSVLVFDGRSAGDEFLDEALKIIAICGQEKGAKWCVRKLSSSMKNLPERFVARMEKQGLLTAKRTKALGIFPHTAYEVRHPEAAIAVRERLRKAILQPGRLDPRSAALAGLCAACEVNILTPAEASRAGTRLRDIVRMDPISAGVAAAVAADAAAVAAVLAATT
jgi:golgi phosphoprotein 3